MGLEELYNVHKRENLEIFYQQQVDFLTEHIVGAKAICKSPLNDGLDYHDFATVAEQTAMVSKLDLWSLESVGALQKRVFAKSRRTIPIYVQVSVGTIINPYNVYEISSLLESFRLPDNSINLVLVNAEEIKHVYGIAGSLKHLINNHIRIYFGDLVTCAIFSELFDDITPSGVVIDKSMFNNVTVDSNKYIVLKALIELCQRLNFDTICDDIEDAMEVKMLLDLGCKKGQGAFYNESLSLSVFEQKYSKLLW